MDEKNTGTPPSKEKREDSKIALFFIGLMVIAILMMIVYIFIK